MVDIYIDEVFPKDPVYPLIVNFQNGYPSDNFKDHQCTLLENNTTKKRSIVTELNNVLYAGEELDEPLNKTFILARNRITGKVRLIEFETAEIKPIFKAKTNVIAEETSKMDLGKKFGSKRMKKMIEQTEKFKVNENVVKEQLKNVSLNISQDQLDLSTFNASGNEDFYIPPINREAKRVEDVFPLHSILSEESFDKIFEELKVADYVPDLLPFIRELHSEKWTKEQKVLAMYASTLFKLHSLVMNLLVSKKFVACPHSPTLDKIVLSDFFLYTGQVKRRTRPTNYKEKMFCHATVCLLILCNYKIEHEWFIKNTKCRINNVHTKFALMGAWTVKQGTKKFYVLKTPVNKIAPGGMKRRSARF